MGMNIDAIATADEIKATYRRYLQSLLAVRDPSMHAALQAAIHEAPILDKGPYLEATPPYAPGASLKDLISEGVLSRGFTDLGGPGLPLDRPLYVHQEAAIRKVAEGRNVVVATGTGSGKTESFLLPILDSLLREHERSELGPGVRALLLYPMNALANDQMKRIRQLLSTFPHITFGRYTGDTEHDPKRARDTFAALNPGEPMLPNELVSREEMRSTPPNILLTNFAMLEYLLLRPLDMDLFATRGDSKWRFIAVDEAHVYDGSQGAEIAMLLRRVRDRVARRTPMQCIATSATVGGDLEKVATFATNLFGQAFEWIKTDSGRQDIITAQRVTLESTAKWGPLTAAEYHKISTADDPAAALSEHAAAEGLDFATAGEALTSEDRMVHLRRTLGKGPLPSKKVAGLLFGNDPDADRGLNALVELGSRLRREDGTTPLSARYHLFLRATEGAFTCLSPNGPHVRLARHENCPECDERVFEIGSCKRCGAVHLVGDPMADGQHHRFMPRRPGHPGTWLVLGQDDAVEDEDEEAVADGGGESLRGDPFLLCGGCGILTTPGLHSCPGCAGRTLRTVHRLGGKGSERGGCLVCGAKGEATVRLFETGADASGAVIASSLYQKIPASSSLEHSLHPGEGRKLLAFSDSRQAAAFFAPYLEDSYGRLQRRRLIALGLSAVPPQDGPLAIEDLVFETRRQAAKVRHFMDGQTSGQQARIVAPWVMAEIVSMDDRLSLEGLGLAVISMYRHPQWQAAAPLLDLGLSPDEAWSFMQELVRSLRQQGAITMPDDVPPNHDVFAPRLGPIHVRGDGAESRRKVLSWLPTRGTNRRLEYVKKVLKSLGVQGDARALLAGVWKYLTSEQTPVNWLRAHTEPGLGIVFQVDHEAMRIEWVPDGQPTHRCTLCRRTTPFSVRSVCPAIGCDGTLTEFMPPPDGQDANHYRSLYRSMHPVPLSAKEHTAQWSSSQAADIQQQFIRSEVNVLSCSTTFELGVDVGELQTVLLRNVPPTTANYLQRAGRAGRRTGSTALVVTYAQRRSHDLTRYGEPEVLMAGNVRAPYVPLGNVRIGRRHAHSIALAAFFRWHFKEFNRIDRTTGEFFEDDDRGLASVDLVRQFLSPVPESLTEELRRALPNDVRTEIGVDDGSWAEELLDLLDTVKQEFRNDITVLEELQDDAAMSKKFSLANRYQKVGTTLTKRDLLGYLANHNVLPKYGFPVNSVELRTNFGYGKGIGGQLDLSRDLSSAIHEYAPDASIVAGGSLWHSRGLYRLPGRELVEYQYQVCRECSGFRHGIDQVTAACPFCGSVEDRAVRTLTIPEFGFVSAREPSPAGTRPPERSWSGATHVLADPPETRSRSWNLPGGTVNISVGARGRLISVADGPAGLGFWVCDWCGYGAARSLQPKPPRQHDHLLRNQQCGGPLRLLDLGHTYETDLLRITMIAPGTRVDVGTWKSLLYALLEAASDSLEIARDDIGGSLTPIGSNEWALVLFDTVGGGAGHVLRIEENLAQVFRSALLRVDSCECGPETSCYGCLRSYGNQRDHEVLSRGAARDLLSSLLDG